MKICKECEWTHCVYPRCKNCEVKKMKCDFCQEEMMEDYLFNKGKRFYCYNCNIMKMVYLE